MTRPFLACSPQAPFTASTSKLIVHNFTAAASSVLWARLSPPSGQRGSSHPGPSRGAAGSQPLQTFHQAHKEPAALPTRPTSSASSDILSPPTSVATPSSPFSPTHLPIVLKLPYSHWLLGLSTSVPSAWKPLTIPLTSCQRSMLPGESSHSDHLCKTAHLLPLQPRLHLQCLHSPLTNHQHYSKYSFCVFSCRRSPVRMELP